VGAELVGAELVVSLTGELAVKVAAEMVARIQVIPERQLGLIILAAAVVVVLKTLKVLEATEVTGL
jgi:hypothetical protein